MKTHLETIGAYDIVFGKSEVTVPKTVATGEKDNEQSTSADLSTSAEDYLQRDRHARSVICSSLNEDETRRIMHCTTAKQIWICLENAYGMKTSNAKLELMSKIGNFKCKSAKEVPLVTNKILGIRDKLSALNTNVDDTLVISSIIKALPSSMQGFLDYWELLDVDQIGRAHV